MQKSKSLQNFAKQSVGGFTIIELLVVIAIIALLSAIVMVSVKGAKEKARIASLLQFSASVKHALGGEIIAEWKFEGNTLDASGNGNNGINGPSYISSASSQLGQAGYFGGGSAVNVPVNNPVPNNLKSIKEAVTVELWIKPEVLPGAGDYDFVLTYMPGFYVYFSGQESKIYFVVTGNSGSSASVSASTSLLKLGKWNHIAGSFKVGATTVELYINGQKFKEVASQWGPGEKITSPPDGDYLSLGGWPSMNFYFTGGLDEVRLYHTSLSSAQIQKLYAKGLERHKD